MPLTVVIDEQSTPEIRQLAQDLEFLSQNYDDLAQAASRALIVLSQGRQSEFDLSESLGRDLVETVASLRELRQQIQTAVEIAGGVSIHEQRRALTADYLNQRTSSGQSRILDQINALGDLTDRHDDLLEQADDIVRAINARTGQLILSQGLRESAEVQEVRQEFLPTADESGRVDAQRLAEDLRQVALGYEQLVDPATRAFVALSENYERIYELVNRDLRESEALLERNEDRNALADSEIGRSIFQVLQDLRDLGERRAAGEDISGLDSNERILVDQLRELLNRFSQYQSPAQLRQRAIAEDLAERSQVITRQNISRLLQEQQELRDAETRIEDRRGVAQLRQDAIGEDLGERSRVITRQNISRLLQEQQELRDAETRIEFERNAAVLDSIFSRVEDRRMELLEYKIYATGILDQHVMLRDRSRRIDREIEQDVAAARQTQEEINIVDEFVALTPLQVLRDRLRVIYDQIIEDQKNLSDELEQGRRAFARDVQEQLDDFLRVPTALAERGSSFLVDAVGIPARLLQAERDAAQERLDIQADLAARVEAISSNTELNAQQRARRIANAEASAAQRRSSVERQLSEDKTEAYTGFIRDALRNLAELVAAEVQAAVVRATVNQIGSLVAPALAGLGTGGTIGLGLAAVAGLQLVASSFHLEENDRVARTAGFQNARQALANNPQSFGTQSADDLVANYDRGFQRGLDRQQQGSSQPAGDRQPIILQVEGRELARILLDMSARGEIPSLT